MMMMNSVYIRQKWNSLGNIIDQNKGEKVLRLIKVYSNDFGLSESIIMVNDDFILLRWLLNNGQ